MKKELIILLIFSLLAMTICGCDSLIELAPVDEIEILILESFPVQVKVVVHGGLPNPCTKITSIEEFREGNTFYVTIKMTRNIFPCIQVIQPYEEVVDLEVIGLSAGKYTVNVNGVTESFVLETDNIISK
jgi:inhibitor of cysteine peptidase